MARLALLWTLCAIIAFAGLPALPAAGQVPVNCSEGGEHDTVVYFLVDRSEQLKNTAPLEQTLQRVRNMVPAGGRLVIGYITDRMSDTRVTLDLVKPKNTVWVSTLKIRAADKKFNECFDAAAKELLIQNESYKTTAIAETLTFVSKILAADAAPNKKVVVFSDMMQNSASLSFYQGETIDPHSNLTRAKKELLIPEFKSVEFYVAGAGLGIADKKARAIEQFWKLFVEAAGGVLRFYGPVLPMS